ncbi:MAG: helix-turn-helix transcriptional regulator [Waltera sp.]
MDAKTTGRFIAELRKQKGYTQKELAEKIMVTDKAISLLGNRKGLLGHPIAKTAGDILGVSVAKVAVGQNNSRSAEMKDQTDRIILDSLKYSSRRCLRIW